MFMERLSGRRTAAAQQPEEAPLADFSYVLAQQPADVLKAIVELRGIRPHPGKAIATKTQLSSFLAQELCSVNSISLALDRCSRGELDVLARFAMLDSDTARASDLITYNAAPNERDLLDGAVHRLTRLGLLLPLNRDLYLPSCVRSRFGSSVQRHATLATYLAAMDAEGLKKLAQVHDVRNASIAAIRTALETEIPSFASRALGSGRLTPDEERILQFVRANYGSAQAWDIANVVNLPTNAFTWSWQSRWKMGQSANPLDRLLEKGLLFVSQFSLGQDVVIPQEVLAALDRADPIPLALLSQPQLDPVDVKTVVRASPGAALRDVVKLLAMIASTQPAVTNAGHMHRSSLKQLAKELTTGEEIPALLAYACAWTGGLIERGEEPPVFRVTRTGMDWLHWTPEQQLARLYEAWLTSAVFDELEDTMLGRYPGSAFADHGWALRRAVVEMLRSLRPGEFVSIASVTILTDYRYPRVFGHMWRSGNWEPASLFLTVIHYLVILGAVSIGNGERIAHAKWEECGVTLTQLGAALVNGEEFSIADLSTLESRFVIQPDAEVFVPPNLEAAVAYELLRLAEPVAGAVDRVRVTSRSISRYLNSGGGSADALAFLQAHSSKGVPQNVEYLILEAGRKHGRLRVGKAGVYVRTDTPELLQELSASRALKGLFVRKVTDTVGILSAPTEERAIRELRKAGYLPVNDDGGAPAPSDSGMTSIRPFSHILPQAKADAPGIDWQAITREAR